MFQVSNDGSWQPAKLYKVTGDANKFYEILSTATLKIVDGETAFIYTTSNGNNWKLKNQDDEDDSANQTDLDILYDMFELKAQQLALDIIDNGYEPEDAAQFFRDYANHIDKAGIE